MEATRNEEQTRSFSTEAKTRYLEFALSPSATWTGNFRDLNASVSRMSTLAPQGRITFNCVEAEIIRLKSQWAMPVEKQGGIVSSQSVLREVGLLLDNIDLFDQAQLAEVIRVVKSSNSIAEAGRRLFDVSRRDRATPNDSDRVRKYLARFGIDAKDWVGRG
jgi:transcriptional regulatory protein RtcR